MHIKQLEKTAISIALQQIEEKGEAFPMFHLSCENNVVIMLPALWKSDEHKLKMAAVVRLYAVRWKAQIITLVTEAWLSEQKSDSKRVQPADDPNRKEMLICITQARKGAVNASAGPLMRDPGGVSVGELKPMKYPTTDTFADLFCEKVPENYRKIIEAMPDHMFNKMIEAMGMKLDASMIYPRAN